MGTNRYVEELEYSDAKGLDTTSPINLLAPGFVRVANNVNLGYTGGYSKRSGYANQFLVANQLNGFSIRQGLEYRYKFQANTAPLTEILLYATDNSTTGRLGKIQSGVFTDLQDNSGSNLVLTATVRPTFAQVNNSLFVFNGADAPFVYEQNVEYTRLAGIDPPAAAPTGTLAVGTDLNVGDYVYAYTYAFEQDGQIIAESSPSPLSATITTTSGNQRVSLVLSSFPDDSFGNQNLSHLTVYIRLWRTVVNGSILFLEKGDIPAISVNPTITYVSEASDDALLPEQMPFDNTKLTEYTDYAQARFPVVARNRLVVFHPTVNKGRFSKIGVNGPLPESFPVTHEFSVEGKFGAADGLVGCGQIKGVPIVLKERSIGRLEEIGLPDLGNSEDNVAYLYREISETVGAVSNFAQCQVFDELIFLGRDNIYATDGQNVRPIATQIQSIIKAADFSGLKAEKLSAINDTKNRRIYMQICENTSEAEPNITLVGDYQQYPTFRWTTYEKGPEANMPGIKAGCFFQTEATASGGLDIYFGSATDEGQYYKMNTGGSDLKTERDAVSITPSIPYMRLVSRPYMFGQPMITKLYKTAKIYAEGQAQSYDFKFGAIFDLAQAPVNTLSLFVPGTGTTWDFFNWAPPVNVSTLIWSGQALNEFKYTTHRKAQMMQLVFTQDDLDAPATLLGWGVSGSIFSGI
jgi:hypothetical protein